MIFMRLLCICFLLLAMFLTWRLIGHADGWSSYTELRQRRDALTQELSAVEEKNIFLSREIRRLTSDRDFLESVIRVEMHYLRPDEILYIPQTEAFRGTP